MKHLYLLLISFMVLSSSCTEGIIGVDTPLGGSYDNLIGWSVSAGENTGLLDPISRALIENYTDLRDACTTKEDHEAEKIGVLGDYTINGQTITAFNNVDLWWWEKEDGNPYFDHLGDYSNWNYPGENVYWTDEADYTFKGYFPKSKVTLQPGSGAEQLLVVYDTQVSQYDFLVSHKKLKSRSENPVKLIMKNALSALKFDFQFVNEGVTDNLVACWLENTDKGRFFTSSTLNFSEEIVWPQSTPNPLGTQLYYWEPSTSLEITGSTPVNAYSTSASAGKGSLYTKNSGWLLIIPQANDEPGTLKLCFKTSTGGNVVYSVGLPAYDFRPGYRYNYHIKMSSTGIRVSLTIADWNERKSSYEIDFNE